MYGSTNILSFSVNKLVIPISQSFLSRGDKISVISGIMILSNKLCNNLKFI